MQNPECSRRLAKWSVELREFDIQYKPQTTLKGHVLVDFILEFIALDSISSEALSEDENNDSPERECSAWTMFVNGASNKTSSEAGVVLQNPVRERIMRAFKYDFAVTNNEAEYEALITSFRMAKDVDV